MLLEKSILFSRIISEDELRDFVVYNGGQWVDCDPEFLQGVFERGDVTLYLRGIDNQNEELDFFVLDSASLRNWSNFMAKGYVQFYGFSIKLYRKGTLNQIQLSRRWLKLLMELEILARKNSLNFIRVTGHAYAYGRKSSVGRNEFRHSRLKQ